MIILFLLGYDVIAQAQSGTGKTATFAISILQQIDVELKGTQALVLAPTRELAQQVSLYSYTHIQNVNPEIRITSLANNGDKVFIFREH